MQQAAPRQHLIGAVGWMMGAVVSLLAMAVAGRELAAEISVFEIMFFRNSICLTIICLVMLYYGRRLLVTRRLGLHLIRNICHFFAQAGWYFGLAFLPLAEVFAIEFTAPIWTVILAAIFLGERLTGQRSLGVFLGFAGILIILRPGLGIFDPAALAVLGAAVGFAATFVITKSLTASDAPLTILFYMNLIQLPLGMVPALLDWVTPSTQLWPWVLVTGLAGLGTHYCFARAFALADAGIVTPIDFVRLPLAGVIGYFFYQEGLDLAVIVGAAVILLGNLLNIRGRYLARS